MKKITLLLLLLALPSVLQAKTLEDLLVEKGVISSQDARAIPQQDDVKVYWNNGTRLEFPENGFTTKMNTLVQTSYKFTDYDSDLRKSGYGKNNTSSFGVENARLILSGNALNKEFSYKLQTEFTSENADVQDAFIQWEPCEKMGFRLGQYKTGISRQFNTSTELLQFPMESVASKTFAMKRQVGLRAFYSDLDDVYSLYGTIYNGESDDEGGVAGGEDHFGSDSRHAFDVSARSNILGKMNPFEEGDVNQTQEFALNVGSTYSYSNLKRALLEDSLEKGQIHRVSADANVKYQGFSLHSEFFWNEYKYDFAEDSKPLGFYTQAGYFFTPEFEVAARYSFMDCDGTSRSACTVYGTKVAASDVNEATLTLNYYFWKHNMKVQLAYSFVDQDIPSALSDEFGTKDAKTNTWMLLFSAYL